MQSALAACYRLGLHRTLIEEGRGCTAYCCAQAWEGAALVEYVRGLMGECPALESAGVPWPPIPIESNDEGGGGANDDMPIPVLTRRELEVIALLEQSMSNKRIALTLNISVQTVKWNLKNIFASCR
jgi:LuxR family maltose regulon positive regulatory protein